MADNLEQDIKKARADVEAIEGGRSAIEYTKDEAWKVATRRLTGLEEDMRERRRQEGGAGPGPSTAAAAEAAAAAAATRRGGPASLSGPPSLNLSNVSKTAWDSRIAPIGVAVRPYEAVIALPEGGAAPAFGWNMELTEPHQKQAYMQYLKDHIQLPSTLCWFNGDEKKTFLSVEPALSQLSFKLSGTTDVAVCTARSIEDMIPHMGIRALFEVKKSVKDRDVYQTAAELYCASIYSCDYKPFGVVTDLGDKWTLLWVAGHTIYTYSPKPRAAAVNMINSLLNKEEVHQGCQELQLNITAADNDPLMPVHKRARLQLPAGPVAENDVANIDDLAGFLPDSEVKEMQLAVGLRSLRQFCCGILDRS